MYSIWVESSSEQLSEIKKIIRTLSDDEGKEYFGRAIDFHIGAEGGEGKTSCNKWKYC